MQIGEYPVGIEQYAVEWWGGEVTSLAQSLESLPITASYRVRLQEALEHFDQYILQLEKLIEPVAQCLLPFLERWAAKLSRCFRNGRPILRSRTCKCG